jgi:hypothetical protein
MTPPLEPEDEAYRPRLIRSYTLTAGRTASKVELAMEATLRLQAGAEAPGQNDHFRARRRLQILSHGSLTAPE